MMFNQCNFVLNYEIFINIEFLFQKSATMGMKWGNMQSNIRGHISYGLSPHEQKAFAGAFTKGLPNMKRRVLSQVAYVCPRKSLHHSIIILEYFT